MNLNEAINICDDKFYDDYKWARYYTDDNPSSSEEVAAHRRIEAWESICNQARAYQASEQSVQDLRQENYRLRTVAEGYESALSRYRDALQEAGVTISNLLAEKVELAMRLHGG